MTNEIRNPNGSIYCSEFTYNDFQKSGISRRVVDNYIKAGYLKDSPDGWTLHFPRFLEEFSSDYFTQRLRYPNDKGKYRNPKDMKTKLFRPLELSIEKLKDKSSPIIITEGCKKAIKATIEGFDCISLGGVYNWKCKPEKDYNTKDLNNADDCDSQDIIPDLQNFDVTGKVIYLCYDSDMFYKEQVKQALYKFAAYLLVEKEAIVKLAILPKGEAKGLDDYLIMHGNDAFQKILDNAETITLRQIQINLSDVKEKGKDKFPVEVFPTKIQKQFTDLQKQMDAPIEYIFCSFLFGASLLMDCKACLCVRKNTEWYEHPILWIAIVGNPAQKKTPCISLFKNFIDEFDTKLTDKYEADKKSHKKAMQEYNKALKDLKKSKNKALSEIPIEPEKPYKQRLTTQNFTVEALAKMYWQNQQCGNNGIAILVDELVTFIKMMGQYKKSSDSDEGYFLQAWKKQLYNVIRQGGELDYTIKVSHNIMGGIQPKVLDKSLFKNTYESYNGMVERWLFACSDYLSTGKTYYIENEFDSDLIRSIYNKLYNMPQTVYSFSSGAQRVFDNFVEDIAKRKLDNRHSDLVKNYLQKQTDYVARFALILHCINNLEKTEIEAVTVENAIKLSKYFIDSFKRVLQESLELNSNEEYTLNLLKTKGIDKISPSKLFKKNTTKYRNKEQALIALENLASKGYGRMIKTNNGGLNFRFYNV